MGTRNLAKWLWEVISHADTTISVLGWIGVPWVWLATLAGTAVIALWSAIQGLPPPVIAVIAIASTAAFLFLICGFLWLIERIKKPNPKIAIETATSKKEENYAITLEVKRTFMSDEEPSLSPVRSFDFIANPYGMSYGDGSSIRDSIPEKDRISPFHRWICEVELSNTGEKGIFNLRVPIKLNYFEVVQNQNGTKNGKLIHASEQVLSLNKLDPSKPITFWIINSTPHFMRIEFLNYLAGETHTLGKNKIPYVYVPLNFPHVTLFPIKKRN